MHARLLLIVVAVVGCKKSKADTCDELAKLGIAVADELGKQLGGKSGKSAGSDPEIKAKMAEFRAECMAWPDEVFECMRNNDETSPKCQAAMTHVTGRTSSDLKSAGEGPAIVARAQLGDPGWEGMRVALAADGTLTAAVKGAIVSVAATGAERWRVEMDHDNWLLATRHTILVGDRGDTHAVVALDAVSGKAKWRARIPQGAEEYSDRNTQGAVRVGDRAYVAIADGRLLRVDETACAKPKQTGCLELAFALADERFDDLALLAIGDDIVIGESNAIRRFTTQGKLVSWIHVRDSLGGVASAGEARIAAAMDDELVLFDLAACPATAVALSRKRGRMHLRGEGDCDDCIAPPDRCLVARSELSDVDAMTPHVLRDGSVAVTNLDGPGRVAPNGNKHWVSEIDSVGPMRELGDHVVFLSRDDDDKPARVVALSTKTGKAAWVRPLDIASDEINSTYDPVIEVAGPWLVAGAKGSIAWMQIQ